jgi:hypothetical protein
VPDVACLVLHTWSCIASWDGCYVYYLPCDILTPVLFVCCLQLSFDVAARKTATPASAAVGSIFTYSVVL